jgi:hypothetical protein
VLTLGRKVTACARKGEQSSPHAHAWRGGLSSGDGGGGEAVIFG